MPGPEKTPRPTRDLDPDDMDQDLDQDMDSDSTMMDDDSSETGDEDVADSDLIARPRSSKKVASDISGRKYRKRDLVSIDELRPSLAERVRQDYPDLPANAKISFGELARYRMLFVEELLQQEHGEFTELDRQVAESISKQDTIAENTEEEFEEHRTFG